jgi:hypothetical protein
MGRGGIEELLKELVDPRTCGRRTRRLVHKDLDATGGFEGLELCFAQLEAEREQTRDQFGYIAGKPEPGKNPLYR